MLKAEDLNAIVEAILTLQSNLNITTNMNNLLLDKHFSNALTVNGGKEWTNEGLTLNSLSLTWNIDFTKLYVNVTLDTDLINYIIQEQDNLVRVIFEESVDLKSTVGTTTNYNFEVNFYLDEELKQHVYTYKDTIVYYYQSNTSSGD